jgi:hypothetical protein
MFSSQQIAKAILFSQTVVMFSVITLLTQGFFLSAIYTPLLYTVLGYNVISIVAHMSYRIWEKKQYPETVSIDQFLLLVHILTSVGAIINSFVIGMLGLHGWLYTITLMLWIVSLLSGYKIYSQKYGGF